MTFTSDLIFDLQLSEDSWISCFRAEESRVTIALALSKINDFNKPTFVRVSVWDLFPAYANPRKLNDKANNKFSNIFLNFWVNSGYK